ncbi:MAG: photosystem II reaction center PsbP [Cyanobacteria bacterium P01_G01_bin.54]
MINLRWVAITLGSLLWLGLLGCSAVTTLPHHLDLARGYAFDLPLGWTEITVREAAPGVVEVWRDPIDRTANLSLIINPVPETTANITELGTATEVGYRFFQERQAQLQASQPDTLLEFLGAAAQQPGLVTYYTLEYALIQPDAPTRHNLARAVIRHHQLFTFNLSLPERRWQQMPEQWRAIVGSFQVF